MLGLGWFRMKEQNSAFSEFCNVGARPVFALSFFKFSESILMPLHRGAPRAPKVRWALRWFERKRLMAEILRGMQLMHLYLMLDAFNPILATAVLEAKDLPPHWHLRVGRIEHHYRCLLTLVHVYFAHQMGSV